MSVEEKTLDTAVEVPARIDESDMAYHKFVLANREQAQRMLAQIQEAAAVAEGGVRSWLNFLFEKYHLDPQSFVVGVNGEIVSRLPTTVSEAVPDQSVEVPDS